MRLAAADMSTGLAFEAADAATHQFTGVMLVSVFAALFWTAMLGAGGAAVGHAPGALALLTVGTAIALFLAAVTRALFARS